MNGPAPRPLGLAVAPSGFKLSAREAAEAIAEGLRRVVPDADTDLIPLVDGGKGTAEALAAATGGALHHLTATGPTGATVPTHFALLGPGARGPAGARTAAVEMAAVAELSLVPPDQRDRGATTTRGVGELIRAALDFGARCVLVGCGDSGTSDGGAGALQALGARLLDADGRELPPGGRALTRLARVDRSRLDPGWPRPNCWSPATRSTCCAARTRRAWPGSSGRRRTRVRPRSRSCRPRSNAGPTSSRAT